MPRRGKHLGKRQRAALKAQASAAPQLTLATQVKSPPARLTVADFYQIGEQTIPSRPPHQYDAELIETFLAKKTARQSHYATTAWAIAEQYWRAHLALQQEFNLSQDDKAQLRDRSNYRRYRRRLYSKRISN
jgi:hypothetical protein